MAQAAPARSLALSLLSLALAFALAAAAAPPKKQPPAKPAPAPAPAKVVPAKPVPAKPASPNADRGDFKVAYEKPKDPDYRELQKIFQETQLLEETVKALNETLALPSNVTVVMRECGEVNAYYEPDEHRISICYELVSSFSEMFTAGVETEEDAEQAGVAVAGATLFIFFHEAGHALIDLYDLPVTGKEEDAVDQLATLILLESGKEGEDAAIDGASTFLTEEEEEDAADDSGEETGLEELAFWDEHSLDQQRFYNIICWVYGKSPKAFADVVEDGTLPEERAEGCPAEYERMSKAWDVLLAPHLKE